MLTGHWLSARAQLKHPTSQDMITMSSESHTGVHHYHQ